MKPQHVFSALLLTAFVVLNGVLLVWLALDNIAQMGLRHGDGPLESVVMGIAVGQMSLAAAYWTLGRINLIVRTVVLIGSLVICANLAATAEQDEVINWICFLLFFVTVIQAPLIVTRVLGVQILGQGEITVRARVWQFTIGEILVVTTAVGIILAASRAIDFDAVKEFLLTEGVIAIVLKLALLFASHLWIGLASVLVPKRVATPLILGLLWAVLSGPIYYFAISKQEALFWAITLSCTACGATILATLILVRMAGYRLVWPVSKIGPPEANSLAEEPVAVEKGHD